MPFLDRADAGRRLAAELAPLRTEQPVVLGLPRGGVPVAYQVALALDAPLDVIVVRKLGVPFQPELGMGAIGEGGVRILNDQIVGAAGVTSRDLAAVEQRERAELDRRTLRLRGGRARVPLSGRTAIIVDDGIARQAAAASGVSTLVSRRVASKRLRASRSRSPSISSWVRPVASRYCA